MKINIFGSTGFVGKYLCNQFNDIYDLNKIKDIKASNNNVDVYINLIGKAHDLKLVSNPSEYYHVNTEISNLIFDNFLKSDASVFIFLSSVKAVADTVDSILTEDSPPNPKTHYGKSKLLAEQYILNKKYSSSKRVYILRPCMIHGPGNKGNLNLLYKIVSKSLPWPLGLFENKRSFCSIDNLCFIINEIIENKQIPSGIYNIADDEALSTISIIEIISRSIGKNARIWYIPKYLIKLISITGDVFCFPLNSERLNKLTETYIVSNEKIKDAIKKPLPITSTDGLFITIKSFINNEQ